jgi:ABC-2 type transport system ATP-binding protein
VNEIQAPQKDAQESAIRTQALCRKYDDFTAIEQLDLVIGQGEIYGLLGSNGAGKTTTIKMLVGLLKPTSGDVWINGYHLVSDALKAKASLGYVADHSMLYERLTGKEFLKFVAQLRGIPRNVAEGHIQELIDLLELGSYANKACATYSLGTKRKVSLAGALLARPAVLVLDEPLNGLDPRSARRMKDLFLKLATEKTCVLLSTHDLATAEAICHRVGIIHQHHLLLEGSAGELRTRLCAPDLETVFLQLTSEQSEALA